MQPSQDNHKNMVNTLYKGRTVPKLTHQGNKSTHYKKKENVSIDEKIEYARSVFLNEMRSQKMILVTKVMTSTI
jgi:hypothetical protein